jgi:hypothetical protein
MEQMLATDTTEARRTEETPASERWTALTYAHIMEQTLTEGITEARRTEQTPTLDCAEHH